MQYLQITGEHMKKEADGSIITELGTYMYEQCTWMTSGGMYNRGTLFHTWLILDWRNYQAKKETFLFQ